MTTAEPIASLGARHPVRLRVDGQTPVETILAAVDRAWRAGHDHIDIDEGQGEQVPRRGLLEIARHIAKRGVALGLVGPASRFATLEGYAERLVRKGNLVSARLVLGDGRVSPIDQAGAELLRTLGVHVDWRCEVSDVAELAAVRRFRQACVEGVEWSVAPGGAVALAAGIARRAMQEGDRIVGLPHCLVDTVAPLTEIDLRGDLGAVGVKPPACAGCGVHGDCVGVSVDSFRNHGDSALRALDAVRPQSTSSLRGVPILDRRVASGHRVAESERLDVAPRYPDTALVTLIVPGCDLACIFCETPQGDTGLQPSTPRGVRAGLAAMAGRADGVFFTGGEPTRLPWLLDAFREARELGLRRVQMQSHAGRAADRTVAAAWVDAGLTAIDVPLYGPDAATHEAITNTPGSFDATLAGLRNLQALGVDAVVHITLFRSNLQALPDVLRLIDELAPGAAYIQTTGEVGPPGTYERVAPSPREVADAVLSALAARPMETPLTVADLAPCLVPGREELLMSWRGPEVRSASPVVLPYSDWLAVFSAGRTRAWGLACDSCSVRAVCPGLPGEALARFGDGLLVPRP